MTLDEQFEDALQRIDALPAQPNDVLLDLYGLYKQALFGDAGDKPPSQWDFRARAKFDAWSSHRGIAAEVAKQNYIQYADQLVTAHQNKG